MLIPLIAVGAVSLVVLLVLVVTLFRHLRGLTRSLQRFQEEVLPILEEIQAGSVQAQDRADRLQSAAASLRASRG